MEDVSLKLSTIYYIISAQYIKKKHLEEINHLKYTILSYTDEFKEEFSNAIIGIDVPIDKREGIFEFNSFSEEWELLNPFQLLDRIKRDKMIKKGELIPIDSINREILTYAQFFKTNFESIILPLYLKSPDIISLSREIDLCYLMICFRPYAESFSGLENLIESRLEFWEDYADYSMTHMCEILCTHVGVRYIFESSYSFKSDALFRRIIREALNTRKSFEKEVLPLYLKNSQKIVLSLKNK